MNGAILDLIIRFIITVAMLIITAGFLYYPRSKKKEFVFTYIIVGMTVFFLCYLLSSINMELGLALGLFAIFGIMRYRTLPVQVREMTYLFLSITLSVINSLTSVGYQTWIILMVNAIILLCAFILELFWFKRMHGNFTVRYEKIDLIRPEHREALIKDLEERLGIEILDVKIGGINFLRDTAVIEVIYDANRYPYYVQHYEGRD